MWFKAFLKAACSKTLSSISPPLPPSRLLCSPLLFSSYITCERLVFVLTFSYRHWAARWISHTGILTVQVPNEPWSVHLCCFLIVVRDMKVNILNPHTNGVMMTLWGHEGPLSYCTSTDCSISNRAKHTEGWNRRSCVGRVREAIIDKLWSCDLLIIS